MRPSWLFCLAIALSTWPGCGDGGEGGTATIPVNDNGSVADTAPPSDPGTAPPVDPGGAFDDPGARPQDPGSPPDFCAPKCEGKECGPNGCGGTCGSCQYPQQCKSGTCEDICLPSCTGKACGDDGCGGSCGTCSALHKCVQGFCVVPSCKDLVDCALACEGPLYECAIECVGPSSMVSPAYFPLIECLAAVCGPSPGPECFTKAASGQCFDAFAACLSCTPQCAGKQCGPDGCGSVCGGCPSGTVCEGGKCGAVPLPSCGEILKCAEGCTVEDFACIEGCTKEGDGEAAELFLDYAFCTTKCNQKMVLDECVIGSCFELYHACAIASEGTLDCPQVNLCTKACPVETAACDIACYQEAQYGASKLHLGYQACLWSVCGPDPSPWCVETQSQEKCAKQYSACFEGTDPPPPPPPPPPDGACANPADLAIFVDLNNELFDIAAKCGLSCLGAPPGCAKQCVSENTGLGDECAACSADLITCAIDECLQQCAADPYSDACLGCIQGSGCTAAFQGCAGVAVPM